MTSGPVSIVSASAGTGKTHHLIGVLADAIASGDARPEGLVAVTYTRKAASELQSRLRQRLMAAGRWDAAARIRDGYLGTVHAVADRLLREYTLEAGLPPSPTLLTEAAKRRLLARALSAVGVDAEIDVLAVRIGVPGWRDGVLARIIAEARANGLGPDALRASGRRSLEGLRRLLREEPTDDADYATELADALAMGLPTLDAARDREGQERAHLASRVLRELRAGRLPPWPSQERLVREISGIRRYDAFGQPLAATFDRHLAHRAFHADLETLVTWMFELAARTLQAYERQKRDARVIDYDDMLAECLVLLDRPDVADDLAQRLDLVVVDEFQDTSPIQLAILLRLSRLARRTVWVGDAKQAIYGFQGADPELMDQASYAALAGRAPDVLAVSWRSRPALVELCSELFARAFAPHGLPRERVAVRAARTDPDELVGVPVLDVWAIEGRGGSAAWREANGIAEGIRATLADGSRVVDGDLTRPAGPGDVAVLLRTNAACEAVARALRDRGIPARVQLAGLLATEEALAARAALALLADPDAGVRALELSWLGGAGAADPDAWLARGIPGEKPPFDDDPRVRAVRDLAPEVAGLSPAQALDRVIDAIGLRGLCLGWPDAARRLANLEALRAESAGYEELCAVERRACTIAGLVAHLADRANPAWDDPSGAVSQAMPTAAGAVTVLTYHKAKGLEWPIVVLGSLWSSYGSSPFAVEVEPAAAFDPADPLAERRIRWWPYPYGDRRRVDPTVLDQRADASPEGRRIAARDARERVRLLYVGFTRARDRLALAAELRDGEARTAWLDELRDADGDALLALPWAERGDHGEARVGGPAGLAVPCRVRRVRGVAAGSTGSAPVEGLRLLFTGPGGQPDDSVHPSSVELPDPAVTVGVGEAVAIGPKLGLRGHVSAMDRLGDAIHGFLAADDARRSASDRADRAAAFLEAQGVADALDPDAVPPLADALIAWVDARWPGATWLREWPVRWQVPTAPPRLLVGEIDLVLDVGDRLVVVDHKSFPGDADTRDARSRAYAGQLAAYRAALESAMGKPVEAMYLHFPLRGEVQEVTVRRGAFEAWVGMPPSPPVPVPVPVPVPDFHAPKARKTRRKPEAPPTDQLALPFASSPSLAPRTK